MEILLVCAGMSVLWTFERIYTKHQARKHLEAETQGQLALEAQRFEKIKEILTDGVIEDSPKALDALKPLVEIMASQMGGDEITKQKDLDHQHRIAEIEAINEPFRLWIGRMGKMFDHFHTPGDLKWPDRYATCVRALQESTQKVFPQMVMPALKTAPPEGSKFHLIEEEAVAKK